MEPDAPALVPRTTVPRGPQTALWDVVETLRADLAAARHPADGGGRVQLAPPPESSASVVVGSPGRWTFVYEAGPLGVAVGGAILLQVPPFWGWDPPQLEAPDAPGYTEVGTDAEGVVLAPRVPDAYLLAIAVEGRRLEPGERVRIVYGAGEAGATADRFAERESRFVFAVDGDGDGVRALLPDPPSVDVGPGPPARLVLHLPSSARPGEPVRLVLAWLDAAGNADVAAAGDVRLSEGAAALGLPERVALRATQRGVAAVEGVAREAGVFRVRAEGPAGLAAESNPLVVVEAAPRLLWADLHGHSNLSDGTGTPEDYFRYARDVAALDVVALTDHDHWGLPFLDQRPELWRRIQEGVARFHEPGRFVTLLGYEWTSWIHGHRHVLYFDAAGTLWSSLDPATDTPAELWQALRGRDALTVPHHPAGGPIALDWSIPPDTELEPVVEIVSVHGCSEAPDAPLAIYAPVAGHFARDALARGYRLGFVGSGDGHDGHPGLAHLAAPSGGLAGIWSEQRTREGVLAALRARRVYATNGPRIWLRMTLGEHPMGATLPADAAANDPLLRVRIAAPGPLARVDVVHSGVVVERVEGDDRRELSFEAPMRGLRAGDFVYVRAIQRDGGAAWASPVFVGESDAPRPSPPSDTAR